MKHAGKSTRVHFPHISKIVLSICENKTIAKTKRNVTNNNAINYTRNLCEYKNSKKKRLTYHCKSSHAQILRGL